MRFLLRFLFRRRRDEMTLTSFQFWLQRDSRSRGCEL